MATKEDYSKNQELGLLGEKIVTNMLNGLGLRVEHSINKYDSEKDMLVDGYKVEVKTETPYAKKDCFSFRPSQLKKCTTVDVLYIVSVPHPKYEHYSGGWVYRIDPKNFEHFTYKTRYGVEMIGIKINQPGVVPVQKMKPEEIKELIKYSVSSYG
jgi:hypothetical protein